MADPTIPAAGVHKKVAPLLVAFKVSIRLSQLISYTPRVMATVGGVKSDVIT